jgi:hypothetical protein
VRAGLTLSVLLVLALQTVLGATPSTSFASKDEGPSYRPQLPADALPAECRQDGKVQPRIVPVQLVPSSSLSWTAPRLVATSAPRLDPSRRACVVGLKRHIPRMSPSDPGG